MSHWRYQNQRPEGALSALSWQWQLWLWADVLQSWQFVSQSLHILEVTQPRHCSNQFRGCWWDKEGWAYMATQAESKAWQRRNGWEGGQYSLWLQGTLCIALGWHRSQLPMFWNWEMTQMSIGWSRGSSQREGQINSNQYLISAYLKNYTHTPTHKCSLANHCVELL